MKIRLLLLCLLAGATFQAHAQLKIGDQPTVQEKSVALDVRGSNGRQGLWLPRVTDTTNLGINGLNPPNGLFIYHVPSNNLLVRLNGIWVPLIKYDTTINKILVNGITPVTGPNIILKAGISPGTTNDFNLVGSPGQNEITINLPDASATVRGVVTNLAQTFAGVKTFSSGAVVTGANGSVSNLTLGLSALTTPAAQTTKYLSVDATGKVTLNALNVINSVTAGGNLMSGPDLVYNTSATGTDFSISSIGNTATWNLPDASATARGVVTNLTQTFGGLKTFASGATVSGATNFTSNLTLGLTSATIPGAQTTSYLSVDGTGKVTLNALNALTSVTAGGTMMSGPALAYATGTTGTDFNIAGVGSTATWNLPDASTTARGVVTNGLQTFGGLKMLENGIIVNNGSTLNGGTTANGGLTVAGAVTSTSNLTLGITSATVPGAQTNRYLSVDGSGKVTLNTLNTLTSVTAGGLLMTGPALTYATGTTGTDFNISGAGNTVTWNIPDASTIARGAITTTAQTLGGLKTLANGVVVDNGSTLNNGATVTGATNFTSNLTLGVTSASTAGPSVEKYLAVDNTGKVTLSTATVITNTAIKIKAFGVGFPSNQQLRPGEFEIYTFSAPAGIVLSQNSTVSVSPVASMDKNFRINWARVSSTTTVEISVAAGNVPNNFNPGQGMAFLVSVLEF